MAQELPKCDSKTWSEQMLLEKWQDTGYRVTANLQFAKKKKKKKKEKENAISAKQYNEMQ